MKNLCRKVSGISSGRSTSPYLVCPPSMGNSIESHVHQSSLSESLSLKMGAPPQHFNGTNQVSFQFQDQDSSSTQSTGQSYPEVASMGEGVGEGHGKPVVGHPRLTSMMGIQDFTYPSAHVDFSQSIARFPLPYAEPYTGSIAAYVPQSMIHPQLIAMNPSRVPLPPDLTEDEPIFVNAKQYNAILRRRRYRAKLEAQNRLIKARKPYLHESRHLHALKRARGTGGRFLNSKKLQESNLNPTNHGLQVAGSENMPASDTRHPDNYRQAAPTTSCSDVTSASNGDDIFQQPLLKFSSYHSRTGGTIQGHSGDMRGSGNQQHHVPVRI